MSTKLPEETYKNLKKYWGFDSFFEGQKQAIHSVLKGDDTLVLLPTGGGKSICYQIPATILEGMTLVISPLISLMQDQVQQLNERGISATFINSTLSSWEVDQRVANARNGMYDLLYCAPERLQTRLWQAELPKLNINIIAVDEAHCISEWGHDFRPSYREIRPSLEVVESTVCWMALTATATPKVRDDIIRNLQFRDPAIISKGFQRPNLKWWVLEGPKKDKNLLKSLKKAAHIGSGIVYGGTKRNCERLAKKISGELGINSAAYHAGLDGPERNTIQEQWISGELPLVVATTAFGMGIDKSDCRFVIHHQMPYSLEAYYQQAGRAGRDGHESYPLLLVSESDAHRAEKRIKDSYPNKEQLQQVYDAVCDTLNLAVGSVQDEMQEISVEALKKRTDLSLHIIRAALETLKHLGIIEKVENTVPKIGLQFIVNPDYIRSFIKEEKNQQKSEFLDVLYRQYSGEAFAEMKYLDRNYIQRKLETTKNGVIKGLQVLQNHDHILRFEALGELPLVRPVEARRKTLSFSTKELEKHRNNLLQKLDYMIGYVETEGCREAYIRRYFGEENVAPCGHCDNCLKDTDVAPEAPSSRDIRNLREILTEGKMSINEIKNRLKWKSRKTEYLLSYLLRENKVTEKGEQYYWKE